VDARAGLFEAAASQGGSQPDFHAALRFGLQAAKGDSAEAQALVGYVLTAGPDDLRDPPRGAHYYHLAARHGFAQGQLGWALALLRDDAQPSARVEAERLLRSAAEVGVPSAHFALGVLAESADAEPGAEQLAVAAAHYRAGAELGHRAAMVRWGLALLAGRGVTPDEQSGETWLRHAGLAGDPQAAALVGDLYARQSGLPPNFCEAALWFQRAAEAGHIGAARALGQICLRGGGFGTDPVAAAHWLRVAATAGDAVAAYDLGLCHAQGIGVRRDDAEAVQWFRRAADTLPAARFWLGRMLAEGRGIAADQAAARDCYLRAAAEGNGDAAVAAGEMLVNGRGGPADRERGMQLFMDAAARGHAGAQYALDVLAAEEAVALENAGV
jgi:TPR repeat protein